MEEKDERSIHLKLVDLVQNLHAYLTLLDQYIPPRDTLHNMDQEEPESNTYDGIDTYEFDDNVSLASSVSTTRSNLSPVIDKSIAKE